MLQQKLTYDPAARFELEAIEVDYRTDGNESWPATIYQPQGEGPFPALVRIHGGSWNSGDRLDGSILDTTLAEAGMVVASVDFRLAPDHPYPAMVQDANYAVRWMKAHASEFNADPRCLGGAGDSSGAHTMMLNALRPRDPRYSALPLDVEADVDGSVAYVLAMWGVLDPWERYHYAQRSGIDYLVERTKAYFLTEEAVQEGSPTLILERGEQVEMPPVIIVQGDKDDNIPPQIPTAFEKAYTARGGHVELNWFPGMPHRFGKLEGPESDDARHRMVEFAARQIAAFAS